MTNNRIRFFVLITSVWLLFSFEASGSFVEDQVLSCRTLTPEYRRKKESEFDAVSAGLPHEEWKLMITHLKEYRNAERSCTRIKKIMGQIVTNLGYAHGFTQEGFPKQAEYRISDFVAPGLDELAGAIENLLKPDYFFAIDFFPEDLLEYANANKKKHKAIDTALTVSGLDSTVSLVITIAAIARKYAFSPDGSQLLSSVFTSFYEADPYRKGNEFDAAVAALYKTRSYLSGFKKGQTITLPTPTYEKEEL